MADYIVNGMMLTAGGLNTTKEFWGLFPSGSLVTFSQGTSTSSTLHVQVQSNGSVYFYDVTLQHEILVDGQYKITSMVIAQSPYLAAPMFQATDLNYVVSETDLNQGNVFNLPLSGDDSIKGGTTYGDNIDAGSGNDAVEGGWGEDTLMGGSGNDTLTGGDQEDSLAGGDGDDLLIAGAITTTTYYDGATTKSYNELGIVLDKLEGGNGNDIYVIGQDDVVTESANGGIDTVVFNPVYQYSPANPDPISTYTLGANVENLTVIASQRVSAVGNDLDNVIKVDVWNPTYDTYGRQATLNGGAGADTLVGGIGSDTFIVQDEGDVVIENSNNGYSWGDTVQTSLSEYALGAHLENLSFMGTGAFVGTGNELDNQFRGGGTVTINGGEGYDTVYLSGNFDDYEASYQDGTLILSGIDGVKSLSNIEAIEFADRYASVGELIPPPSTTTYSVRSLGDAKEGETITFEVSRDGPDLSAVTISYTFGGFFSGTARAGVDHSGTDGTVTLGVGEATKTVTITVYNDEWHEDTESAVFFSPQLGTGAVANIFNVDPPPPVPEQIYAGDDALWGTSGNNTLKGYGGRDALFAGAGNDRLYGGSGNDHLVGGSGKDTFVFDTKANRYTNKDIIVDFKIVDDTVRLDNSIFTKVGANGWLKSGAFWTNNTGRAHDRSDRIIYDKDSGVLYYDADGTGKAAAVAFATISKNLVLTHKDFYVI